MAVSDDKIALGYVQAFLCHRGGHQQVDVAVAEFVQDFPLLRLMRAKVEMTTRLGRVGTADSDSAHGLLLPTYRCHWLHNALVSPANDVRGLHPDVGELWVFLNPLAQRNGTEACFGEDDSSARLPFAELAQNRSPQLRQALVFIIWILREHL